MQRIELVFAFASDVEPGKRYVTELIPNAPTRVSCPLPHLVLVSKSWRRLIQEIEKDFDVTTSRRCFKTGGEQELDANYEMLETSGEKFCDLHVHFGTGSKIGVFILEPGLDSLEKVDALEIDWDRTFASCKNIQRLDLTWLSLESARLCSILDAASTH